MSLTNPNDVVTEQRLSEFYGEIYPYLGGLPELVCNKFSRADLYSTNEKMVGQWIDGKPLYQKVIYGGAAVPNTPVNHNIENVDFIFIKFAILRDTSDGHTEILPNYNNSSDYLGRIYAGKTTISMGGTNTWSSYVYWCILNYTKTTDSSVEIGNDTDYSTTEKIVGTWIDGKPLYQKTIAFPNIGTDYYHYEDLSSLNIDKMINVTGRALNAENQQIPIIFANPSVTSKGVLVRYISSGNLEVSTGTQVSISDVYVTIQYTKTTD